MAQRKAGAISPEKLQEEVLDGGKTALICFLEEWSEPCKEMDATVDDLADALFGQADVYRMGLEAAPLIAAQHGINSIPALVLFVGGQPVQKLFGVRSLEDILRILSKHVPKAQ